MNEIESAWKQSIADAAEYLETNPWDSKNDSKTHYLTYNGNYYPPKEIYKKACSIMTEKFPELEFQNLKGGDDTNNFLRKYEYEIGGIEVTKPGTKLFQKMLCELQNSLNTKPGQRKFIINKRIQTSYYAWIFDPEKKIGGWDAHYELIRRRSNGSNVYLELHFEDPDVLYPISRLLNLDKAGVIKKINHEGTTAIQFQQEFHLHSSDTVTDIINALNEFDDLVGHELRKIMDKKPLITDSETERNQILYGPPGTGKTYRTIDEALKITDFDYYKKVMESKVDDKAKRKELTNRFKKLLIKDWKNPGEGRIVFTTFHQSLSYEDFIEGIKPQKDEGEKEVYYEIQDGIFKQLCTLAGQQRSANNFEQAYAKFTEDMAEEESIELETFARKVKFDVEINGNHTAVAIPKTKKTRMSVTKDMIREYLLTGEIRDWKSYVTAIGSYIQKKYGVEVKETDNLKNKYVIIIDEINRGNVSSIFGELITLIEPSKRKGKDEELEVFLPYSKKPFAVPDNVYLIGTMNTADRSVEALDTALRRRFSFTEMMPEPDLLPASGVDGINLNSMLTSINARLAKLIDKDHQIGHAYFIGIENRQQLVYTFKNKILPLLSEYFYGEIGKIGLVLGGSFVENEVSDITFAEFDDFSPSEKADLASKVSYKISNPKHWDFDKI